MTNIQTVSTPEFTARVAVLNNLFVELRDLNANNLRYLKSPEGQAYVAAQVEGNEYYTFEEVMEGSIYQLEGEIEKYEGYLVSVKEEIADGSLNDGNIERVIYSLQQTLAKLKQESILGGALEGPTLPVEVTLSIAEVITAARLTQQSFEALRVFLDTPEASAILEDTQKQLTDDTSAFGDAIGGVGGAMTGALMDDEEAGDELGDVMGDMFSSFADMFFGNIDIREAAIASAESTIKECKDLSAEITRKVQAEVVSVEELPELVAELREKRIELYRELKKQGCEVCDGVVKLSK